MRCVEHEKPFKTHLKENCSNCSSVLLKVVRNTTSLLRAGGTRVKSIHIVLRILGDTWGFEGEVWRPPPHYPAP
jgi:hypothetical protein